MYLLLVALPLFGTIFSGLFGRWLGRKGSAIITIFFVASSFFLSCYSFFTLALNKTIYTLKLNPWITTDNFILEWGFLFDTLTCVMLVVITSISSLVHLYSTEYMKEDPHLSRFMSYLSFFTFFMLILVTADNLLQMFVGWEGVGLCSYLLINFWYGRLQANKAALKAMYLNRIGDFGLALAIFTTFYFYKTLDYAVIFALSPSFIDQKIFFFSNSIYLLDFIGFFLFVGAVGKSAQIGLHTWLPDAMEGPTPVSALIHAATMVTAGVFLLCRCSPLFQYASSVSTLVTIAGGMTAFFAATTGLLQNDLKRVIAYSTCSQLGYMVFAAGLSTYSVSMFHLSNHAFFKALLFLGAGSIIHAMSDEQDMRKMGGLVKILPFTYATTVTGSLALMGFPFLTGFYSKDVILEVAFGSFVFEGRFVHTLGYLAAFFTAFYSTRLIVLTFLMTPQGSSHFYEHAHESPWPMTLPLFLLSFGSLFIGYLTKDMFIGMGSDFWGNAIFILPSKHYMLDSEWLSTFVKMIPFIVSLLGVFSAYIIHSEVSFKNFMSFRNFLYKNLLKIFTIVFIEKVVIIMKNLYIFLNRKWFFDKIYNEVFSQNLLNVAYKHAYLNLDRGIVEFLGPQGIYTKIYSVSNTIKNVELGFFFRILKIHTIILLVYVYWLCYL